MHKGHFVAVGFVFGFVLALALVTVSVYAGGDKVRGDNGVGEVVQEGPCPFGDDTPAGPNDL
ncbi:hypothetical protein C4561_05140 [candidate division WWE3 bacterium]|jgi:hypothetical protein|uniref:Uncharacterized protein n=1 Tax=candidate division WWE3 bacterium TaxID=2053526 RepID=A0A3A4ZB09_UNCKA|nr:MAG: hypothetical protein C4561_05140 [candidate division WWE3 bacterium]